jgi:hypothetical protein
VTTPLIQYRIHESQQVGIDTVSLWDKFMELRAGPKRQPGIKLRQFEELRERWVNKPGSDYEEVLHAIEGNISFLNDRFALSPTGISRIRKILALSGSYPLYANGFRSILNDIASCIVQSLKRC